MTDYRRHPDPKRQLAEILRGEHTSPRRRVPKPVLYGCAAKLDSPLVLTFPLPPKELNPNVSHSAHWVRTCKAKNAYKADVRLKLMIDNVPPLMLERARTETRFYFASRRKRDQDNAAASCKGLWDVFTEWGIWRDDEHVRHEPPELLVDRKSPRLEVSIFS
jgi:Holliday junction resolvase RusA-like endonuclease